MFMTVLVALMAGTASPPPPPPPGPEAAQVDHDGYRGQDLWQAWLAWVRASALSERDATYAAGLDRSGWRRVEDGPRTTRSTGYWNEGFEASFVQLCEISTDRCEWVFRSARLSAQPDALHDLAVRTFDGPAIAEDLRERGISAQDLPGRDAVAFPGLVALEPGLEGMRQVQVVWEHDCPTVGDWRNRLAAEPALPLGPVAGAEPPRQVPPYPIHVRQIVEFPVDAFSGADVTIRIEGVRNRAVADLWQAVTRGIADCQ